MLGLFLSYFIQTSVTPLQRVLSPEEGSGIHLSEKEQYNSHCVIDGDSGLNPPSPLPFSFIKSTKRPRAGSQGWMRSSRKVIQLEVGKDNFGLEDNLGSKDNFESGAPGLEDSAPGHSERKH